MNCGISLHFNAYPYDEDRYRSDATLIVNRRENCGSDMPYELVYPSHPKSTFSRYAGRSSPCSVVRIIRIYVTVWHQLPDSTADIKQKNGRTSWGGFRPHFFALSHRWSRVTPTHGPYLELMSNIRRISISAQGEHFDDQRRCYIARVGEDHDQRFDVSHNVASQRTMNIIMRLRTCMDCT